MSKENVDAAVDKHSVEYWEEKVTVFIPEGNDGEGNLPFNVSVNGECITVPRGKEVMVARKFAEVIKHSEQAKKDARNFARAKEGTVQIG